MKRGLIHLSLTMALVSTHIRAAELVSYQVAADAVAAAVFKMPASKDIADVEQELAVAIEATKKLNPGRESEVDAFAGEFFGVILPACEAGVRSFISYKFQSSLPDDVMQDVYTFVKSEEGAAFFQAFSSRSGTLPDNEAIQAFLVSSSGREFAALMRNLNDPPGSFRDHCSKAQVSAFREHVERYSAMGITFTPDVLEMLGE